ncbi:hypothetical protein Cgig2_021855 [Carnegiea gigantea]|uniref:Uncharacterized protein n=1 Tax=Carnegiea gigantea TaxID=171969 RepID=A0A9Q1GJA0_9CARY|nr:hypothetical protein Cgig2_021855 [Carnegiea gigantea]
MTQIVQSLGLSSIECSPTRNDGLYQNAHLNPTLNNNTHSPSSAALDTVSAERKRRRQGRQEEEEGEEEQLTFLGVFLSVAKRSVFGCSSDWESDKGGLSAAISSSAPFGMEIGLPTNVRHLAHVTFDRFNGFLGLPVEFEPEVPGRAPSARINADNGQEEYVRDQLNRGLIPDNVGIHCLAGLIKAWFRELPTGVLDCLSPEQVMQSQTEEECTWLARLLPPTETALLDWAINLMADVAQFEDLNKMNARNVAMVFAPNMTHMDDPLTALMHAVQVMNFLKRLIEKTLREREDSILDSALESFSRDPSGGNDHLYPLQTIPEESNDHDDQEDEHSKSSHPAADDNFQMGDEAAQGDDNLTAEVKENEITRAKSKVTKTSTARLLLLERVQERPVKGLRHRDDNRNNNIAYQFLPIVFARR